VRACVHACVCIDMTRLYVGRRTGHTNRSCKRCAY